MKATAIRSHAVALVGLVIAASVASAQVMGTRKPPIASPGTSASLATLVGKCSKADKVMVSNMTLLPAAPKQGDRVTVTLTVKNLCDVAASVPWQITGPASLMLGSAVQQNVAAGASFVVNAVWTATAGPGGAYGWADPKNVLGESVTDRQNNGKAVTVNVPSISASTQGTPLTLVQEVLNFKKAKNAGARFDPGIPAGTVGCERIFVQDPIAMTLTPSSVEFGLSHCALNTSVEPEAFAGFTLKNGWRIKHVANPVVEQSAGDYQYVIRPTEGSNNPTIKMRLSTTVPVIGQIFLHVAITIEGPEGTCPYTATSGPCP